jgi:DNA polymerase
MSMAESTRPIEPCLNTMQLAWLQEIGIDKRSLARYKTQAGLRASAARPDAPGRIPLARGTVADAPPAAPAPLAEGPRAGLTSVAALLKKSPLEAPQRALGRPGSPALSRAPAAPEGLSGPPRLEPLPDDWNALRERVVHCQLCTLCASRSQAVFGEGSTQAPAWMIIGEAPGDHDDRIGQPFQGNAGVLLRAMLESIGVGPQTPVFFTNLIKCRPLGNRAPSPQEIAACLPYLQRQIALIAPQRILALGRLAAQALVGDGSDFEQLRGRVHGLASESGAQIPMVVTYHPASLLLRPQHKADAWRDLNLARTMLAD